MQEKSDEESILEEIIGKVELESAKVECKAILNRENVFDFPKGRTYNRNAVF